jgi:hypothetical protein
MWRTLPTKLSCKRRSERASVICPHGGFRHFVDLPRCITDRAARRSPEGRRDRHQFGNTFNNPRFSPGAAEDTGGAARSVPAPSLLSWLKSIGKSPKGCRSLSGCGFQKTLRWVRTSSRVIDTASG